MTAPRLQLANLTKRYGPARALRGVDLTADRGECIALLGPNGAGKSTLLRIVAGLARPTSGEVRIDGETIDSLGASARARLGLVSHHLMLHEALSARENLAFAARLHGLTDFRFRSDQILRSLALHERADEPVRQLSRGLAQRAAIARAVLHDPEILLLDEPFTGLDRASGEALQSMLRTQLKRGRLLVLVTHDLGPAAALATRVLHLRQGRLALESAWSGGDAASLQALLDREAGAA